MVLQILDAHWREHLAALDHLRQGIHLRGYAQKNPKQEYKREAFELFGAMVESVKLEVIKTLTAVQIRTQEDIKPDDESHVENVRPGPSTSDGATQAEPDYNGDVAVAEAPKKRPVRVGQKVGRNDPCPCGSGKKYKHCHGNYLQSDSHTNCVAARVVANEVPTARGVDRNLVVAVNLPAPQPESLLPIPGVELGVAMAGVKKPGRKDLLVMRLAPGTEVAGVFTQNRFCAAPVLLCRKNIRKDVTALVVNTGNANAGTGEDGLKRAAASLRGARRRISAATPRGAAVLHRRDHGAAAGRAHRRGAAARRCSRRATGCRRPRRS